MQAFMREANSGSTWSNIYSGTANSTSAGLLNSGTAALILFQNQKAFRGKFSGCGAPMYMLQ